MQNYKIAQRNGNERLFFFAKCKNSFYQMQKAIRDFLLTFAPEFNKS